MPMSETTIMASLVSLTFASIVGPLVTYLLSEARMSKQREWDRQDRQKTAVVAEKTTTALKTVVDDTKNETGLVRSKVAELKAMTASQHVQAIAVAREALRLALSNQDLLKQLHPTGGRSRLPRAAGAGGRVDGPLTDDEQQS